MNEREQLMKKLSGAQFAALEMRLYLDTHKNDAKAVKSHMEYCKQAGELMEQYEKAYGPLKPCDIYGDTRNKWTDSPWPWETESEVMN